MVTRNAYNVNVKPLHRMGREASQSWKMKPLLLCFCQCLVHSPSPARNSDSWWSVHGPNWMPERSPDLQPVYSSGSSCRVQIVGQFNSFEVLHLVHAVYSHCCTFRNVCACVVQVFQCHSVLSWLCKLLFLNSNCILSYMHRVIK
jgi:hypothetical protein